jgi:hypothetical protein
MEASEAQTWKRLPYYPVNRMEVLAYRGMG